MTMRKWIKVSFFFAWYDFWIGWFYDQKKRTLYVCPLPCCVLKFEQKFALDIDEETSAFLRDSQTHLLMECAMLGHDYSCPTDDGLICVRCGAAK